MRSISIISCIISFVLLSCSEEPKSEKKESNIIDYIYENFPIPQEEVEFIFVLNPNNNCGACQKLAFELSSSHQEIVTVIAPLKIARFYNQPNVLTDASGEVFKRIGANFNSKLYLVKNKNLIKEFIVSPENEEEILNEIQSIEN